MSIKPKQPTSQYPLTQKVADNRMKTPSTPSLKVTPNTAPPIKVPTPPTQQTLETATTINVVQIAPTRKTFASTTAQLKVTNAAELLLNNQSVKIKTNQFQLTPSMRPKYSRTFQSLSQTPGISTTPTFETNSVLKQRMTLRPLNSNISFIEHSEGKEYDTNDVNTSGIKTEVMATSLQTRAFMFPTTTSASINVTITSDQRGDQMKGFDMFQLTNSGTSRENMTYIPSGRFLSSIEFGGNSKSNTNHSTNVFGLPGINDVVRSDDKPILSDATTEGLPQALGINFDDIKMFPPVDGIHLPGLESDDRGLPVMSDTDDTTAESYNEGFGLFENVKSGIIDSAIS